MDIKHLPVMYNEVLEHLVPFSEDPYLIDCTTGEGGHTQVFLDKYENLNVIGLDRDEKIQAKAIKRFENYKNRFTPVNCWFNEYLENKEAESVDLILFDLGISVFHYVESERGFSFRNDEELDMRLDINQRVSAKTIVNEYSQEDLANIIYTYSEERYSRRIAERIVREREEKEIVSAKELADIISIAVPKDYRYGKIHPATRTFQALRIEVNKELDRITPSLEAAIKVVKVGGRIAVITFHSLEDRIVKWFFKNYGEKIKIITKRPIIAGDEELKINPPSRSAKLRIIEKKESI